jgi:hypothetical protein
VTVTLQDGRELYSGVIDGGLRFPQPGWDEARMEEKFRWAAGFVLDPSRIDTLVEMLWRFEMTPSVRELFGVLEFKTAADGLGFT